MAARVDPSLWRKRGSSKKLRNVVLAELGRGAMTPHELAAQIGKRWLQVCGALNDLMVRGQVEVEGCRFRRVA